MDHTVKNVMNEWLMKQRKGRRLWNAYIIGVYIKSNVVIRCLRELDVRVSELNKMMSLCERGKESV